MNQLLSISSNNENITNQEEELSDYEDVVLPKMQRMNALIVYEQQEELRIKNFVPKNIAKIYFSENCPICLEKKQLLPLECGHMFCFEDIQELFIQARKANKNILCSICRTEQNPSFYFDKQLQHSSQTAL